MHTVCIGYLPISIIVAPTLQISADRPWPVCFITSGAIHGTDPRMVFMLSSRDKVHMPASCFEQPKSANLAMPESVTNTLAPLISRWIISLE